MIKLVGIMDRKFEVEGWTPGGTWFTTDGKRTTAPSARRRYWRRKRCLLPPSIRPLRSSIATLSWSGFIESRPKFHQDSERKTQEITKQPFIVQFIDSLLYIYFKVIRNISPLSVYSLLIHRTTHDYEVKSIENHRGTETQYTYRYFCQKLFSRSGREWKTSRSIFRTTSKRDIRIIFWLRFRKISNWSEINYRIWLKIICDVDGQ